VLFILADDVRAAFRGLRRARAYSFTAILILAAGIAGTVAMATLVQGVLLRPLPIVDQDRVVIAWRDLPTSAYVGHPFGRAEMEHVAASEGVFTAVAGLDANGGGSEVVVDGDDAVPVTSALVAGGFFDVLGVAPVLGRTLTAADDVDGAESVVVISHGLWQRRYGGSPTVIGRRVHIAERPFTIVGVIPAGLDLPTGTQLWRPTASVPTGGAFGDAARREVNLVGRLRPTATIEQARAELAARLRHLEEQAAAGRARGYVPVVRPLGDTVVGPSRPLLLGLLGAVGLLLLIACANVATLQLLRSEDRRAELAIHAALGAGRARAIRRLIGESFLISLAATIVAAPLAFWAVSALTPALDGVLPRLDAVHVDGRLLAFVICVPFATTALAVLVPAIALGRTDVATVLRTAGRGATTRLGRWRRGLVAAQVALAVVVVAGGLLFVRSVRALAAIDSGLGSDQLTFVDLVLPGSAAGAGSPRAVQARDALIARLAANPAVVSVTAVNAWPYGGGWDVPVFTAERQEARQVSANPSLNLEAIGPAHFATLRLPIVRGRAFSEADRKGAPLVAIVSADVAARTWPGESAIGKRLKFGGIDSSEEWRTVVGVAADARYRELEKARPTLYLPAAQFLDPAQGLAVRTTLTPAALAAALRAEARAVDAGVRVLRVAAFEAIRREPMARPRFQARLASVFGAAAWLLAAVGLYAVLAAAVRHRQAEIAIRVAVGASSRRIRRLVVAETLSLVGAGTAAGLLLSMAATRLIPMAPAGLPAFDLASLAGAAALLAAAAAAAAWLPIRRAIQVDVVATLRG
jgi:putative ABC transport system permease protein